MADFRVPRGQPEKPRYVRKPGAKPGEKVIQVRIPISGTPKTTDIDLWGGGPPSDLTLKVALADTSIASLAELTSPGQHLRRFRITPKKAGKTDLTGKLTSGRDYTEKAEIFIHNFRSGLKFDRLWNAYSTQNVGGDCEAHVGNQCAIKLSAAMTKAGIPVGLDYTDPICVADGIRHACGARSLGHYLNKKIGRPEEYETEEKAKAGVKDRRGIILFGQFHIDVWNGTRCGSNQYFYKTPVWFWELE